MILVSEPQLHQMLYLVQNSQQGVHFLFTPHEIRDSFSDRYSVPMDHHVLEKVLEQWMSQPTLGHKRVYLESLDPLMFAQMVRAYFSLVSNSSTSDNKPPSEVMQ